MALHATIKAQNNLKQRFSAKRTLSTCIAPFLTCRQTSLVLSNLSLELSSQASCSVMVPAWVVSACCEACVGMPRKVCALTPNVCRTVAFLAPYGLQPSFDLLFRSRQGISRRNQASLTLMLKPVDSRL